MTEKCVNLVTDTVTVATIGVTGRGEEFVVVATRRGIAENTVVTSITGRSAERRRNIITRRDRVTEILGTVRDHERSNTSEDDRLCTSLGPISHKHFTAFLHPICTCMSASVKLIINLIPIYKHLKHTDIL